MSHQTDFDLELGFDRDFEALVRDELHRTIVPPAASDALCERVERIGEAARTPQPGPVGTLRRVMGGGFGPFVHSPMRGLIAAVAIAALVVGALLMNGITSTPPVARTPHPRPTPPATSGATFPKALDTSRLSSLVSWAPGLLAVVTTEKDGAQATNDGGHTWYRLASPVPPDLDFLDSNFGWGADMPGTAGDQRVASGPLNVSLTHDGGRTWQSRRIDSLPFEGDGTWAVTAHFADPHHGIVLASLTSGNLYADKPTIKAIDCRLYTTDDGGTTWHADGEGPCIFAPGLAVHWFSSSAAEPLAGWVPALREQAGNVTSGSDISFTLDGGRTWRTGSLPVSADRKIKIEALLRDGPSDARLIADWFPHDGEGLPLPEIVFRTRDGGATWVEDYRLTLPANTGMGIFGGEVSNFSVFGPDHWRTTAQTEELDGLGVYETWDAGRTWDKLEIKDTIFKGSGVAWWDEWHGMVSGGVDDCTDRTRSCGGTGSVWFTDDAGKTWHRIPF